MVGFAASGTLVGALLLLELFIPQHSDLLDKMQFECNFCILGSISLPSQLELYFDKFCDCLGFSFCIA